MQFSRIRPAVIGGLVVLAVAVAAVVVVSAQQRRGTGLVRDTVRNTVRNTGLTVDEYIEATQLYGLYTRDIDPGTVRSADWSFTPDGVAVMERTVKGEQDVKEYYENVVKRAQKNGTRHVTTTYVIVGTEDGRARGSAYNLGVQRTGEGLPLQFQGIGKYEDTMIKTKDGWRFANRTSISDTFTGSDKVLPPSPMPGVSEAPWEYKR